MSKHRTIAISLCCGALMLSLPLRANAETGQPPSASLSQVLNDSTLWGRDFRAALAQLPSWNSVGEPRVAVFNNQILGAMQYERPEQADAKAAELARTMSTGHPPFSLKFRNLSAEERPGSFHVQVVAVTEDEFWHVAWGDSALQFLPANLTLAQVRERLGPPETVIEEAVQTLSDRRPVILRLNSYAGGAVIFAESEASLIPGSVDRVLLDVTAVAAALFEGREKIAPSPFKNKGEPTSHNRPAGPVPTATIVDIANDATDPSNRADTEPSIAVNPTNPLDLAVVSFSGSWSATVMASVWKSSDGGATWRRVDQIPQPPGGGSGPGDQKIDFDGAGGLLIAELGGGDHVYRQAGLPDDPLVAGARYGNDQPHLGVDKIAGSPCANQVYSPWLNFGVTRERSTVSYSIDTGVTMVDVAVGDNSLFPNRTTRIAIAADGKAYVVYKTREGATPGGFEKAHFRVSRTDDCGVTWAGLGPGGVSIHGDNQVETFFTNNFGITGSGRKVARARSSDAWIAINPIDGSIVVSYVSKDASGFGQIYIATSADQGVTWSSSVVTDGTHHCAYPEIAIADNGVIGVLYVDFEDAGTATIFRHHLSRSFDGGTTWTDQILQAMDPFPIPNAASGFLWGDYEGLTAIGNIFYGVFTGEGIGRTTRQLDPIFFSETAVP